MYAKTIACAAAATFGLLALPGGTATRIVTGTMDAVKTATHALGGAPATSKATQPRQAAASAPKLENYKP